MGVRQNQLYLFTLSMSSSSTNIRSTSRVSPSMNVISSRVSSSHISSSTLVSSSQVNPWINNTFSRLNNTSIESSNTSNIIPLSRFDVPRATHDVPRPKPIPKYQLKIMANRSLNDEEKQLKIKSYRDNERQRKQERRL